jgi:structural protein KPP10_ORF10
MSVQTYDPKEIFVTIGGAAMQGFADGTFVTLDRNEDAFSTVSGADGIVARVKSNNRAGTLTLSLQQTSLSNDILSGFALLDEISNTGTFPILIKDNQGTSLIFSATGWVQKMPAVEYSKDISNREWVIGLADLTYFIGGNTTAS